MSAPLDLDAAARYIAELAERDLDLDSPIPAAMLALVGEWRLVQELAHELARRDPRPIEAHAKTLRSLGSAPALLAECRRQRDEIAQLRAALQEIVRWTNGSRYPDWTKLQATEKAQASQRIARAALAASEGEGA